MSRWRQDSFQRFLQCWHHLQQKQSDKDHWTSCRSWKPNSIPCGCICARWSWQSCKCGLRRRFAWWSESRRSCLWPQTRFLQDCREAERRPWGTWKTCLCRDHPQVPEKDQFINEWFSNTLIWQIFYLSFDDEIFRSQIFSDFAGFWGGLGDAKLWRRYSSFFQKAHRDMFVHTKVPDLLFLMTWWCWTAANSLK